MRRGGCVVRQVNCYTGISGDGKRMQFQHFGPPNLPTLAGAAAEVDVERVKN